MSMIDGNILLTGYDVVGRVELIDALDRHDESTDDDLDDLRYALDSDVQVIAFARTDVDGLSDYDDDFDLIDEA